MNKTLYEAIEAQKKIREAVTPFADLLKGQSTLLDKISEITQPAITIAKTIEDITAPTRKLAELTKGIDAPLDTARNIAPTLSFGISPLFEYGKALQSIVNKYSFPLFTQLTEQAERTADSIH